MAALRVGVGLAFYLSGRVDLTLPSPIPVAAFAILGASFAGVGGMLLIGHQRDPRAGWLGGVLLLLAVPLTQRLVAQPFAPTYEVIGALRPDAFLPAFLCWFVAVFPSAVHDRRRAFATVVGATCVVFGSLVMAANLSTVLWPLPAIEHRVAAAADWRLLLTPVRLGGRLFWGSIFLASLAAMATLLARLTTSRKPERFRLQVFIGSLVLGLSPLVLTVLIEIAFPAFEAWSHQPAVEPWLATLLFVPLASVPLTTAYSVLYDRIVETRIVLRTAAQYALARVTIGAVTSVPFLGLALFLVQNRTESIVSLLTGGRPWFLTAAVVAGALASRHKRAWLSALDRRYFREPHDTQELLTHLMSGDWLSQAPAAIGARLAQELDSAFHARTDLFVLDAASGELLRVDGGGEALHLRSTLATLLTASPEPMQVTLRHDSPLARIAADEQAWLQQGRYELLVPLRARSSELIGLLALAAKRSELPYGPAERRALSAIATSVALALENDRLLSSPGVDTAAPASECTVCARLHAAGARQCACGGAVAEARAPHLLRGVYEFQQRLGAGGMGVVYLARDRALERQVAIKTLPQVTAPNQARLRGEALAMASMVDGNLAVIYGIESWRGIPFLIEEYLEGGTLSDRLRRGPLPIAATLDLGVTLAATLARIHAAGIVHCDIKPSNIGFSGHGVPKLIDFGIAHLLRSSGEALTATLGAASPVLTGTGVTDHGLVGTPPYMSPEALLGSRPQPQFDLWSLTVVLFEAIAGRRPFDGRDFAEVSLAVLGGPAPDIRRWQPTCSDRLAGFLARGLARDAGLRPETAAGLQGELLALRDQHR